MNWEAAHADAIGGRSEQQDRGEIWFDRNGRAFLAIVADGMGGHEGGALAAQSVIDVAKELWESHRRPIERADELLSKICITAHVRINCAAKNARQKPGSTCAILYGDEHTVAWAHVGDSRIYHFRNGVMVGRSHDHSMVQLLVDQGKISEAEMATHPDQNLILQSIGGERDPKPEFGKATPASGDAFLLCSDGLWEAVTPGEMGKALLGKSLSAMATSLVTTAARRRGARSDNVTAALIRVAAPIKTPRHYSFWITLIIAMSIAVVGAAALFVSILVNGWLWNPSTLHRYHNKVHGFSTVQVVGENSRLPVRTVLRRDLAG